MENVILPLSGLAAVGIVAVMAYWTYSLLRAQAREREDLQHDREHVRRQRINQIGRTTRWLELKLGAALARRQNRLTLADGYERDADHMLGVNLDCIGDRDLVHDVRRIVADRAHSDLEILITMAVAQRALDRQRRRLTDDDDSSLIAGTMDVVDEVTGSNAFDGRARVGQVRTMSPRKSPRRSS